MTNVQTDLVGEYVKIPSEGDAGWVRAVYTSGGGSLLVLVHRDNPSGDFKIYNTLNMVITHQERK